jgi:hypothetical protein
MLTAIGIDIGYANCGVCVLPLDDPRRPLYWARERVFFGKGRPSEDQLWHACYAWCIKNKARLDSAAVIAIESQMRAKFKVMNCVIRTLHPQTTIVVHPFTLCSYYDLRRRRVEKKTDAICWCRVCFDVPLPPDAKQDDMADAALMALYAAETLE